MTFSISGRCGETGMLGIAITTSSICVGSRCPWVRAGVGAVSTQNITLPSIGPAVLDQLQSGHSAETALRTVMDSEANARYRQVTVIDHNGATASFSGSETLGTNAVSAGRDCVAAGNLLNEATLPKVMVQSFEAGGGVHLADRLLTALEHGLHEGGGEQGPVHSAALLVAASCDWPLVDLRIDWDVNDPIASLRELWDAYEPQMDDYVTRALNPSAAPSFGVPGDE